MDIGLLPEIIDVSQAVFDAQHRVLIHNDDVTPFDFVIVVLRSVFQLSHEIAEHVALTAHLTGLALVLVRPKAEAERLVARAHMAARIEGFPLSFSLEPDA
jgi:ATP-dependent Clp protease adaptor protein ClpS